ncbi:hypothetical protein PHMEG_0006619 [Phytophthora megakarya]|uniref:Uncharacterized protein n=1 Tax=Phytophthora megakarya TaxID=4795 RepID=A0A225WPD7_9STRA|nr:hypothetical protein PHMEG_0006619 [Phytophthora megakarya]
MEDLVGIPNRTGVGIAYRKLLELRAPNNSLPHIALLIDAFLVDFPNQKAFHEACRLGASVQVLEFLLTQYWEYAAHRAPRNGHLHIIR